MLSALGRLLGWIWGGLDTLRKVLHLVLLLVLFGGLWALFSRSIPFVPDSAALVIAPQGPIVEQLTGDPIERTLADSLRQAPSADAAARPGRGDPRARATMRASLRSISISAAWKAPASPSSPRSLPPSIRSARAASRSSRSRTSTTRASTTLPRTPTRSISTRRAWPSSTATRTMACSSRTRSTSSRSTGTCSASASTSPRPRCSAATTCRRPSARRAWPGSRRSGARTRPMSPAPADSSPSALQLYADDSVAALKRAGGDLAKMALDAGLVTALRGRTDVEERLVQITGPNGDDEDLRRRRSLVVSGQSALAGGAVDRAGRQGRCHRRQRARSCPASSRPA